MTQLTRRNLLKTGLAASAGLIAADNAFYVPESEAAMAGTQSHPALSTSLEEVYKQVSSRERSSGTFE